MNKYNTVFLVVLVVPKHTREYESEVYKGERKSTELFRWAYEKVEEFALELGIDKKNIKIKKVKMKLIESNEEEL